MANIQDVIEKAKYNLVNTEDKRENIINRLNKTKEMLDDFYNQKIEELENLNPPVLDENGNPYDPVNFEKEEKLSFLKMCMAERELNNPNSKDKSKFLADLKNETKKVDITREKLKGYAEEILGYKASLIATVKGQIEDFKKSIVEQKDLKEEYRVKKENYDLVCSNNAKYYTEYEDLEKKLADIFQKKEEKQKEIDSKKQELDNENDPDKKLVLQEELNSLNSEYDQLEYDYNITTSECNTVKQHYEEGIRNEQILEPSVRELANKIKGFAELSELKISELEKIYIDFDKSLDDDIVKFDEAFKDVGIDLSMPGSPNEAKEQEDVTGEGENKDSKADDKGKDKDKSKGNANTSTASTPTSVDDLASTLPITKKDKRFQANKIIADNFIKASPEEQRYMLDNYGYKDIVNMSEYLGPLNRMKLSQILEERLRESKPGKGDFSLAVESVTGKSAKDLFSNLVDKNRKTIPFNKLDKVTLREIQTIIDEFNKNKDKLSSEQIESFDKNFIQYIKSNALLQASKQGRFKTFFRNVFDRESNNLRNGILFSMSSYTSQKAANREKREDSITGIREKLGMQVSQDISSRGPVKNTRIDKNRTFGKER